MDRVCITEGVKVNIHCPTCDAGYAVIRVRKQPGKTYHRIRCRVCRSPLSPIEGDDILNYFLVRKPPYPPMHGD
jgi:hypothetical protein